VEYLKADEVSAETVGLAVRRGTATDLIHSSPSPTEQCEWTGADQPLVVAGEFALLTVDEKGVERAVLVNGTLLQYGEFSLRAAPSPQGELVSVEVEHNTITIDTALDAPEACRDAVVILGNEIQKTSYTIKDAKVTNGSTTLDFGDVLFTIGMGAVAEADQVANTITSDRPLTGYGRVDGGRHAGRWLYNEDKSRGFRIAAITDNKFELEAVDGDLAEIFADADGDGRRQYWISDIGPGDTYRIPSTTYYARGARLN